MATGKSPYFDQLLGAIELFDRSENIARLAENVSAFSKRLGYEHAAYTAGPYGSKDFKRRILLSTWPVGWIEQYSKPGWNQRDRVAHTLRAKKTAFLWSSVEIRKDDKPAIRVMDTAAQDFGMRFGLCVPVHDRNGCQSAFSFSGYDADQTANALGLMQIIGVYAVSKFSSFESTKKKVGVLTPREREVMTWVAVGKTAWDIGEILHISEETVKKTAKNAMAKLNTHTRAQAAVEAYRTGEINL